MTCFPSIKKLSVSYLRIGKSKNKFGLDAEHLAAPRLKLETFVLKKANIKIFNNFNLQSEKIIINDECGVIMISETSWEFNKT